MNDMIYSTRRSDFDLLCAWCKDVAGKTVVENSHGMCDACFRRLMGLPDLSRDQLDNLPFGVIIVDASGIIETYNRAEEQFSGRRADEVIGKNFFTEVAPCTRVKEFHGRFLQFLQSDEPLIRFNFIFKFGHDYDRVRISMVHIDDHSGAAITITKSINPM